ncbi:MAG: BON domain-containing protein [Zetaproteobacteria bacterium]|nr:MAG: BON domain-containing protein [Zetaproteobacteria bacterium]
MAAVARALMICALVACAGCAPVVVAGVGAGGAALAFDRRPASQHAADVAMAAKIDAKLIAAKDVDAGWISVEVIDGEVHLTGFVPDARQKARAEAIARSEKGVRAVKNDLAIGRPSVKEGLSDSWITAKVKAALFDDPVVSGWSVHVETVRGKVYLRGVVGSRKEAERAQRLAFAVDGVRAVVNLLRVEEGR